MEFYPTIKSGEPNYPPVQLAMRERYLHSLKDGTKLKETYTKLGKPKSHQQVKTIFGLVIATVLQGFDDNGWDSSILLNMEKPTGVPVSVGLLKEYFYAVCPIEDDDGDRITLSSKKCTMAKAAKFINETRNIASSQWSIYIPDPDPNRNKEKIEKE